MPELVRVTCSSKAEGPDEGRITAIGGVRDDGTRWKLHAPEAAAAITEGRWAFVVQYQDHTLTVIAEEDESGPPNLLAAMGPAGTNILFRLPECPIAGWSPLP